MPKVLAAITEARNECGLKGYGIWTIGVISIMQFQKIRVSIQLVSPASGEPQRLWYR